MTRYLLLFDSYGLIFCGAPSLTTGRVCLLYMLLALASAVFLGSESLGTRNHILLSQIWDFPFRRLLRLAGSRWRYSTPPPHGDAWVAPVFFKITTRHGPHGKRLPYCWDVLEPFPGNGRGTDLQKTSYVIAIVSDYWRADCCLATSNNIRNSIVAYVNSVARRLPVRCLAIHVTISF
jgi:hypothetical protein